MRNIYRIAILCFFIVCFFILPALADQEDARDKHKDLQQPSAKKASGTVSGVKDKLSYNVYLGILEGYDNNVYLNPARKGDTFDQAMADVVFRYRLSDKLDIKAHYDFTSITYHKFTDVSMLDNQVAASFEYYP